MPIRFFCLVCGQVLSISRRKAGTEVRCPRCGAQQVVPDESDEEAQRQAKARRARHAEGSSSQAGLSSAQIPQAVAVENAPPNSTGAAEASRPPPKPSQYKWKRQEQGDTSDTRPAPVQAVPNEMILLRRDAIPGYIVLLVVGCLAGTAIGYWAGRGSVPAPQGTTAKSSSAANPVLFEGRVMYRAGGAQLTPDEQAVLIVLPEKTAPEHPWSIEGFRPWETAQPPPPATRDALTEMGGTFTRVDQEGHFSVVLPEEGRYRVLIISRHLARSGMADELALQQIGKYFIRPSDLVGDQKFTWQSVEIDSQAQPFVHTFQMQDDLLDATS